VTQDSPERSQVAYKGLGYISQNIQRVLDVLEVLAEFSAVDGLTLTALSARLGLPKSTTLRLLANLEIRGFVEQDGDRRYHIGLPLFSIGAQAVQGSGLRRRVRPYLEELAYAVGESTYLAIRHQDGVLYIDRIESPQPVRAVSPIGSHRPLHATAVGKVLMANMDGPEVEGIVARRGLAPVTEYTITDMPTLLERLEQVRRDDYDLDFGEYNNELTCSAAPLRDAEGKVVAAIGISGPAWRITEARVPKVISELTKSARAISAELGYRFVPTTVVEPVEEDSVFDREAGA
jgi:DNA-binding IclR family transcriptional regulator